MNRKMIGSKRIYGKKFIIALALSMCVATPVYATENTQPAPEQQQEAASEEAQPEQQANPEQQAAQQEGEQPAEAATEEAATAVTTNTTTRRTTSRTGRTSTAATAASSEAASDSSSEEGEEENALAGLEITNGKYTLTLNKNANMRSEASTDAESRIVIPMGMTLSSNRKVVNAAGETWYEVTYATLTGFIREDLAEVVTESVETNEEAEEETEGEEEEAVEEEAVAEEVPEASTEETSTASTVTPHSVVNSDKSTQDEAASGVSDLSYTSTDSDVKVKSRKKFDFVVLLFIVIAGIGMALVIAVFDRFKTETKRLRDIVRKHLRKEKKNIFQKIED